MPFDAFFRCARNKDPDHEPIMAWVDAADMMYLTGLEQYSESVFLHIAYANFLSTYKKSATVRTSTSHICLPLTAWAASAQFVSVGHRLPILR